MSDKPGASHAQPRFAAGSPAQGGILPRRWPLYLGGAVTALLLIAYIDAGEEPIHPIVEPVELPSEETGE